MTGGNILLQGTNPRLTIRVPADKLNLADLDRFELTLAQGTNISIKTNEDVTIDTEANTVTYQFTQAETLALDPHQPLTWQARFRLQSGDIIGTWASTIKVVDLISSEVI